MKSFTLWPVLAICTLFSAFGLSIYRANTQPIAHDEAMEYELFLSGGVSNVLTYHPTNHVLFTLLAKPIVWSLGNREIVLRCPSLFGAAIYLLAVYLLCRRLFGRSVLLFLAVAMLSLNPQILDFMSAARGYILGLAGLAVAMHLMACLAERGEFNPTDSEWKWCCIFASIALAFSVAGNFTNFVPAACLAAVFSIVAMGGPHCLLKTADYRLRKFFKYFLAPGAVTGFCLLWPYLIQVRPSHFYAGQATARDAIRDTFEASFLYKWTEDIYSSSLGALPTPAVSWQERVTEMGIFVLSPVLLCTVVAGVVLAWRPKDGCRSNQDQYCRIFGGAAVASVALIGLFHVAAKVHYPNSRFCLFLIPLFTVGGLLAAREIHNRFPLQRLKALGLLLAAIVISDYALAINVKSFRYNAYDIISFDLYQALEKDAHSQGLSNVRVGGTWWYEPEINFYRVRYRAKWMSPYDVKDRSYVWQSPDALEPVAYDYFVFVPASDPHLTGPRIRTIFHDDKTQATIIAIAHD